MPYLDGPRDLPPGPPIDGGGAAAGPPGMLLRPAVPDALARATPFASASPESALELDADRLVRLLARRNALPQRWSTPAFAREVELVRAHLGPIRSRLTLAASFAREAFHGQAAPGSDVALGRSAVRVAYALRWLELGDGVSRGTWPTLLP